MQEKDQSTASYPIEHQAKEKKEVGNKACKQAKKPKHKTQQDNMVISNQLSAQSAIYNELPAQSEMHLHPEEMNKECIDDLIEKWLSDPDAFQ